MDSRLFMEIGFVNDTFQAIDRSPYERWINDSVLDSSYGHVKLQRIVSLKDGEDNILINDSKETCSSVDELRNPWEIDSISDGLYYYQKILIPINHENASNEILLYDESLNKVIYHDVDSQEDVIYDPNKDFDSIYELIRTEEISNCFYFDDYTFSMYNLIKCYVLLEKDRINDYLKNNCSADNCGKNKDLQVKVDILLAAIMVINNLIEQKNFFEAQRILNGLNTCGSLCKDYANKGLMNCGCGRT